MVSNKKIKEAIEKQAKFYPVQLYNQTAILELLDYINYEYDNVLDIGCGDGGLLELLKQRFINTLCYGLTISEEEKKAALNKGITAIVGEATNIPFNNEEFSLIISRHMLEHSPYPEEVIREMNRVLKDKGTLIICVPSLESEMACKWEDHFSVLSLETWIKLFTENGFEIVKQENGFWLASSSMKREAEYRFVLKKKYEISKKNISKYNLTIPQNDVNIAVLIHNYMLFDTIEPALNSMKIKYDLYIVSYQGETWGDMSKDTYEYLKKRGYNPILIKQTINKKYKIVLEALDYHVNIPADFHIRFNYGLAKEATNYSEWNLKYDYIVCFGKYDASHLSEYAIPIEAGMFKFLNFKPKIKKLKSDKLNILYLPTYGPQSSIEELHEELFNLSDTFNITIKAHHGTTFLEPERMELLKKFNSVYDHKKSLKELLENTDIVISDGSGAIFDTIYCDIPIIIYDKFNKVYQNSESLEHRLIIEDLVPNFNKIIDLRKTILEALNDKRYMKSRKNLKKSLFSDAESGLKKLKELFNKIIEDKIEEEEMQKLNNSKKLFINYNQINKAKIQFYNNLVEQQSNLLESINEKQKCIIIQEDFIEEQKQELKDYEEKLNCIYNSTSWKITKPIRNFKVYIKRFNLLDRKSKNER